MGWYEKMMGVREGFEGKCQDCGKTIEMSEDVFLFACDACREKRREKLEREGKILTPDYTLTDFHIKTMTDEEILAKFETITFLQHTVIVVDHKWPES